MKKIHYILEVQCSKRISETTWIGVLTKPLLLPLCELLSFTVFSFKQKTKTIPELLCCWAQGLKEAMKLSWQLLLDQFWNSERLSGSGQCNLLKLFHQLLISSICITNLWVSKHLTHNFCNNPMWQIRTVTMSSRKHENGIYVCTFWQQMWHQLTRT